MSITSKRAAEVLSMAVTFNGCGRCTSDELREAVRLAVAALQEKAEREDPKPLTLEELRQMDGEPVWIKAKHYMTFADVVNIIGKEDGDSFLRLKLCYRLQENGYGRTWTAYRHKPKEVEK
jgi:hypothetical protein